jgi:HD superfamily phosphohydrolase YqeK
MCSKATTDTDLAREVVRRLSGQDGEGRARLAHVRRVVDIVCAIAAGSGWRRDRAAAVERAAWAHDVLRLEDPDHLRRRIEAAGEEPDPWALAHAPALLHAQAAAVWAADRGETDPEVLMAIRHHPTAHPDWGPVGRLLYVADFCEPGRPFAERLRTADLRRLAGEGSEGLTVASRRVLALRVARDTEKERPIHPLSRRAWEAWKEVAA